MSLRAWLPILLSSWLMACGSDEPSEDGSSDDSSDSDGVGGLGGGGTEGELPASASAKIGPRGGELRTSFAQVKIPPGALSSEREIRVDALSTSAAQKLPPLPAGTETVSKIARFRPHGLLFDEDVEIELQSTKSRPRLVVTRLSDEDDPTWEVVTKSKPNSSGAVTIKVRSFSLYALVDDPDELLPDVGPIETPVGTGGTSGTGGTGGTGGALPNGYFDNGLWHGFGSLTLSLGATATSNLDTSPAPHCFSGETQSVEGSSAELSYHLQESKAGGDHVSVTPQASGLHVDVREAHGRDVQILLHSGSTTWCYELDSPSGLSEYVPYSDFRVDCDMEGAFYEGGSIERIGFRVTNRDVESDPFEVCVDAFAEGEEFTPGYMEGAHFQGYTFVLTGGATTVTSDNESNLTPPYCVSGTMGAGSGDYAQIGLEVSQSRAGETGATITPTGTGLYVRTSSDDNLRRYVFVGTPTTSWCAPLFGGGEFVPWAELKENCDGTGASYAGQPISTSRVHAYSQGESEPIYFCLEELDSGSLEYPGYRSYADFGGYASAGHSSGASIFSNAMRHHGGEEICAYGEVPQATAGSEWASVSLALTQDEGGVPTVFEPDGFGLTFTYYKTTSAPLTARLTDQQGNRYCSPLVESNYVISYTDFYADCGGQGDGTPYPGTPLSEISVVVYADGELDHGFEFCLADVVETRINP